MSGSPTCSLEYFVGYIAKKCIDKSQCCETFLDSLSAILSAIT